MQKVNENNRLYRRFIVTKTDTHTPTHNTSHTRAQTHTDTYTEQLSAVHSCHCYCQCVWSCPSVLFLRGKLAKSKFISYLQQQQQFNHSTGEVSVSMAQWKFVQQIIQLCFNWTFVFTVNRPKLSNYLCVFKKFFVLFAFLGWVDTNPQIPIRVT